MPEQDRQRQILYGLLGDLPPRDRSIRSTVVDRGEHIVLVRPPVGLCDGVEKRLRIAGATDGAAAGFFAEFK